MSWAKLIANYWTCRQAAALLQLLNAMAGGRDVGTAVTITCQTIIKGQGHISAQPPVKRLAYNIVKGAALSDSDWDNVLVGFQHDISPTYPSIEVSVFTQSLDGTGFLHHPLRICRAWQAHLLGGTQPEA